MKQAILPLLQQYWPAIEVGDRYVADLRDPGSNLVGEFSGRIKQVFIRQSQREFVAQQPFYGFILLPYGGDFPQQFTRIDRQARGRHGGGGSGSASQIW